MNFVYQNQQVRRKNHDKKHWQTSFILASLDTDQSHVFHPAGRVAQNKVNVPVTIKVSAEYMQVMTVRKQEFLYNVTTILNDVYMISDIEDITIVPNTRNQEIVNEFHFKYKGKTQHVFTSMKRDAIVNVSIIELKLIK
jgi:neurofibromin 1